MPDTGAGLYRCDRCASYGLTYSRPYPPAGFLEGKPDSQVWIVGLNPKGNPDRQDRRNSEELARYFEGKVHPYFDDFQRVSGQLYDLLGRGGGAAHTDAVKCYANRFPPSNGGLVAAREIVRNCRPYLRDQLQAHAPRLIVCNGSPVCQVMKELIPPVHEHGASYTGLVGGQEVAVVLSGFVGRLDNYAKLRLGREVEGYLERLAFPVTAATKRNAGTQDPIAALTLEAEHVNDTVR